MSEIVRPPHDIQPELTHLEHRLLESDTRRLDSETVLELAWNIGTRPGLYRQIIGNPYSEESELLLQETFPDEWFYHKPELRRAVVMAEPDGRYDRTFRDLPREEKQDVLYEQIDQSAEMTMRLTQHMAQNYELYWGLTSEEIYERLIDVAFGTNDQTEIEEHYAMKQRRGFRMGIVNFIEDLHVLKPYKKNVEDNPKGTFEELFKRPITQPGAIQAEVLPIGIMFYIHEDDYANFTHVINKEKAHYSTRAVTSFGDTLPDDLVGRVGIMNMGGPRGGNIPGNLAAKSRHHEILHMFYSGYFNEYDYRQPFKTREVLNEVNTTKEYQKYAEDLKAYFQRYLTDEIIAYYTSDELFYLNMSVTGGNKWKHHLKEVTMHLRQQKDMTSEQKNEINAHFQNAFSDYVRNIGEYQYVAQQLYNHASEGTGRNALTKEKVTALLQNTRPDKIIRLAHYVGETPETIRRLYQEDRKTFIHDFTSSVDKAIETMDENTPLDDERQEFRWHGKLGGEVLMRLNAEYPVELLPTLMKGIKHMYSDRFVSSCLNATEVILAANYHMLSQGELRRYRQDLIEMQQKRSDKVFPYSKNVANRILGDLDALYLNGGPDFTYSAAERQTNEAKL